MLISPCIRLECLPLGDEGGFLGEVILCGVTEITVRFNRGLLLPVFAFLR